MWQTTANGCFTSTGDGQPHHITLGERERGGAGMGGKNPTPKEKKKPKKAKTAKA